MVVFLYVVVYTLLMCMSTLLSLDEIFALCWNFCNEYLFLCFNLFRFWEIIPLVLVLTCRSIYFTFDFRSHVYWLPLLISTRLNANTSRDFKQSQRWTHWFNRLSQHVHTLTRANKSYFLFNWPLLKTHFICLCSCKICAVFVETKPESNSRKLRKVQSPPH